MTIQWNRPNDCVSDLQMDQLLAGELTADAAESLRRHVTDCSDCALRFGRVNDGHDNFVADMPPLQMPIRAPRRWFSWQLGLASTVCVAAVVAFLALKSDLPHSTGEVTTLKGGDRIGLYIERGDRVRIAGPHETVRSGDKLQFVYSAAKSRFLTILSLDGAGVANVYFPDPSVARAAKLAAGSSQPLYTSIVLDDVLGDERIFAVFCTHPVDIEPMRLALQATRVLDAPPGCRVDHRSLRKVGGR